MPRIFQALLLFISRSIWVVKYATKPLCIFPISECSESEWCVCSACYWRFCIGFEGVYLPSMLSGSHLKAIGFSLLIVSEIMLYCYSTFFEYSTTTTYYIFLYIFRWSCCRTPMKMYKDCFHLKLLWKWKVGYRGNPYKADVKSKV